MPGAARHAVFILAFAAMVIGFVVAWVVLAVMLYGLMSSFGRLLGLLMVIFTVAGAGMSLVALSHLLPPVSSPNPSVDAGMLAPILQRYNPVLLLAQLFSGLWLFPSVGSFSARVSRRSFWGGASSLEALATWRFSRPPST